MPKRFLRDGILESRAVNSLSWGAEVFYRRLMSKVDDFGRYYADTGVLLGHLYGRKLDKVAEADVGKWLTECVTADLVSLYTANGEAYLVFHKLGEPRAKGSKFPAPPPELSCKHLLADENICSQTQTNVPPSPSPSLSPSPSPTTGVSAKPKRATKDLVDPGAADIPADLRPYESSIREFAAWRRESLRKPILAGSWGRFLGECRKFGATLPAVVAQSIANGWQGLFALKPDSGATSRVFAGSQTDQEVAKYGGR